MAMIGSSILRMTALFREMHAGPRINCAVDHATVIAAGEE
jgi:hypothetical protein